MQFESDNPIKEVPGNTLNLDEEMERVFAGVSDGPGPNRFDLSKFTSDQSPEPESRQFCEDDYSSKSYKKRISFILSLGLLLMNTVGQILYNCL